MRSTAFFKLYNICILLHRCNLKIFAKNRFEKTAIFVKFHKKKCKCRKICKIVKDMNYNFFYSTDLKKPQKTSEDLRKPQKTSENLKILKNPTGGSAFLRSQKTSKKVKSHV